MTVGPPDIGQRTATAAAEEGRSRFVDLVLNEFVETTRISVPDEVRDYILAEVLVPDEEWERGRLAGDLDAERVARALRDTLLVVTSKYGGQFPSVQEVNVVFHNEIEDKGQCWFPFWFC